MKIIKKLFKKIFGWFGKPEMDLQRFEELESKKIRRSK
jgi:hypothetical protein